MGEEIGAVGGFDDLTGVHDRQPVRGLGHHPQVMGDEEHRQPGLRLQPLEQAQHLGLNGDVQGRGGLVGDQQLRITGQGHGNHDALLHTAGELMGIFPDTPPRVRDADGIKQFQNPVGHRPAVTIGVGRHRLGDLAAHRQDGVEGGLGLLEDHAHAAAPHPAHGTLRQGQ
jgi:hypothetical protein